MQSGSLQPVNNLKAQISPSFPFKTLNIWPGTVSTCGSSNSREGPEQAEESRTGMQGMSSYLRWGVMVLALMLNSGVVGLFWKRSSWFRQVKHGWSVYCHIKVNKRHTDLSGVIPHKYLSEAVQKCCSEYNGNVDLLNKLYRWHVVVFFMFLHESGFSYACTLDCNVLTVTHVCLSVCWRTEHR